MLFTNYNGKKKIIALVDCNSFYVSCERLFNPKISQSPVIVLSNNDGCVIARSSEAKKVGIKMGEPYFKIKNIVTVNNVQVFSSNYALYGDISRRIMTILKNIFPVIEYYSIDEAFLDLSDMPIKNMNNFITDIKKTIYQSTGIPVSIGVGSNKTLSKIANHLAKRNLEGVIDLTKLPDEEINNVLKNIDIKDVWGVGRQLSILYKKNKINNAYELKYSSSSWIKKNTNVFGLKTVMELNGASCITLETSKQKKRKSCCVSKSFGKKVESFEKLKEAVVTHCLNAAEKIREDRQLVKSVIVFIRTSPFDKHLFLSRSEKIDLAILTDDSMILSRACIDALKKIFAKGYRYQKAGVVFLGLVNNNEYGQNLFVDKSSQKSNSLMKAIDSMNVKFGRNSLTLADSGVGHCWKMRRNHSSKIDTSHFDFLPTVKSG
ncbi:error-prone, lesion bypass DNA polymerase V (UmuC) [Candidatus Pelagibacter sp. IMCC9063]|uniref:Y-family DNA polymerase n=1 Tax=Pelagibacter sp. (strain IMCC9063) TaxID=1002672 RepID=UPI0002046685|nr:Y-family DNA polymerase [Candidatus Pelagibacter sp. IMCC9063]AEA81373.1 error-prone, lesion bypass DNA polymerase V (UmuC) [Candidatus Pelagibacter sp. IMCC9063]